MLKGLATLKGRIINAPDDLSTGGRKYVPSGIAGFDSEEEKEVA